MAAGKPFLAGESANAYAGWFNAPAGSLLAKAASNGGQLEGVLDLVSAFGAVPQTIYLASAAYVTADGGALVAQCPAGNGDGNLDPGEFLVLQIPAIVDRNADGLFDRLDPALDFTAQGARAGSDFIFTWNAVPGQSYAVRTSARPDGGWQDAPGGFFTAGAFELTLSFVDPGALARGSRFYHVELQGRALPAARLR